MRRLILASVLVLAGCGSQASPSGGDNRQDGTAPATETASTSSTTGNAPSTTSTASPQNVPIDDTTVFRPGTRYEGSLDVVTQDFELEFQLESWRVIDRGVGEGKFVTVGNLSTTPGAEVILMAWKERSDPDAVLSWFLNHPDVTDATTVEDAEVAGLPAMVVDVQIGDPNSEDECFGRIRVVADAARDTNTPGGVAIQEILGCTWARIWVVDVAGFSITAAGVAHRASVDEGVEVAPWQIEDFEPLLDDFINAITFCTEATPCDE